LITTTTGEPEELGEDEARWANDGLTTGFEERPVSIVIESEPFVYQA